MNVQLSIKPKYRQTEIGLIPEDWNTTSLGSLSAFITKGSTPTTYGFKWEASGILFLRSECVSDNGLDLDQSMLISKQAHSMLGRSEVRDGDILITITGNVGRVVLLSGVGIANLNQHIARIRIVSPSADANYVFQYLNQPAVRQYYNKITTGQAYPQISLVQVRDTEVPLPSLPEQRAIAAALSDADALIASVDALVAKKRDIKQAAMQQLLTGKMRLPGFKGEWARRSLGSMSAFITKGATPTTFGFDWQTDGVMFLRSECVSDRGLDLTQSMFISGEAHKVLMRSQVCPGDLLITITGNVGRVVQLPDSFGVANVNQHIARIRITSEDANPKYVYHQLSDPGYTKYFRSIVTGQAYPQISLRQVRETMVPMPRLDEQSAIATVLSDMDAELAALEAKRVKTRSIKQGMMQELLTGRIRLV